jgi:membrane-associated phospholipid phosphatase
MRAALALLVACMLASGRVGAEEAPPPAPPADEPVTAPVELRHHVLADGVVSGVLAASLVTWTAAKSSTTSAKCTICDGTAPGKVNPLDDLFRTALRRSDGSAAATASHIVAYGAAPLMGAALTIGVAAADRRSSEVPVNALLVLEASLAAIAVNEGVGALILRERPAVHALDGKEKAIALTEADALRSFPSGHTASVMAITAAAATIASLRGYRLAPLVWIVGTTLGLTTTYLRIAADQSYLTDDLTGAAIGLIVGAGVPLIFHRRIDDSPLGATRWLQGATLTSSAVPGGRVVGLGWAF